MTKIYTDKELRKIWDDYGFQMGIGLESFKYFICEFLNEHQKKV